MLDVVRNFRKMCIKILSFSEIEFLSAPGLAWQATLKQTEVKLKFLTNIDMVLMAEKRIMKKEYAMQFIEIQTLITNI